jgi:uncharacterized protein YndB with AHSA1/START domain
MSDAMIDPVRCSITIRAPHERTFAVFVEAIGRWWPIPYTYGEDQFATVVIERRVGGRWFERKLDGSEENWGAVRAFEPGRRIVLSFNVSPERRPEPPERESEVEIRFLPEGERTRLELEHRDFAKHGEGAAKLRAGLARQGWPIILASFAREMRYQTASAVSARRGGSNH